MRTTHCLRLLIIIMLLGYACPGYSQSAPRWVTKGAEVLQKDRSNDTYDFVVFHTHSQDMAKIEIDAILELKNYVVDQYGAKPDSVRIDLVLNSRPERYIVMFPNAVRPDNTIIAELIDTYSKFEDYEVNYFEYEYYQLYAVSKPGIMPEFDTFTLSDKYNSKAVVLSLVPGLGQIYKDQNTKGYLFMGGTAAFLGAAVVFDYYVRDTHKRGQEDPFFIDSWNSKERGWKTFRTLSLCGAGITYIYNLIDAAVSKGPAQVVVTKPKAYNFSILPFAAPDQVGMALCLSF